MISGKSTYPELPVVLPGDAGFRWFLAREGLETWVRRAEAYLLGRSGDEAIEPIKKAENRLVFRIHDTSGDSIRASMVAKTFPMSTLKQRIYSYRRYGHTEVRNLLEAGRRKLPVPNVLGFGVQRRWAGVLASAVLMEDMAPRLPAADLFESSAGDRPRSDHIMDIASDVMIEFYRAGCNHIDMNGNSIWIDEALAQAVKVIDFQYVRFLPRPSLNALMFQAGYFTKACRRFFSEAVLDAWVVELCRKVGLEDADRWLDVCRSYRGQQLTRRRRLAIK